MACQTHTELKSKKAVISLALSTFVENLVFELFYGKNVRDCVRVAVTSFMFMCLTDAKYKAFCLLGIEPMTFASLTNELHEHV